jgi:hypothetical protein
MIRDYYSRGMGEDFVEITTSGTILIVGIGYGLFVCSCKQAQNQLLASTRTMEQPIPPTPRCKV